MSKLHLQIFTPEQIFFSSQEVRAVFFSGTVGDFGILPDHVFLISMLRSGRMVVFVGQESHTFFSPSGYLIVKNNQCDVFVEQIWNVSDLHVAEIEKTIENSDNDLRAIIEQAKLDVLKMPAMRY